VLVQPSVVAQLGGQGGSAAAQPDPGTQDQSQAQACAQSSTPRHAFSPWQATLHAPTPHATPAPQLLVPEHSKMHELALMHWTAPQAPVPEQGAEHVSAVPQVSPPRQAF
jgi:hypothetical protein